MDQIYPDSSLVPILQRVATPSIVYRLFTNNLTPDRSTILANFTEAGWTGYASQTVLLADFTLTGVSGHVGTITAADVAFANTSGSPQAAYGYYMTDVGNSMLLGCARFDGAPVSIPDGGFQNVTPKLGDFSSLAS